MCQECFYFAYFTDPIKSLPMFCLTGVFSPLMIPAVFFSSTSEEYKFYFGIGVLLTILFPPAGFWWISTKSPQENLASEIIPICGLILSVFFTALLYVPGVLFNLFYFSWCILNVSLYIGKD